MQSLEDHPFGIREPKRMKLSALKRAISRPEQICQFDILVKQTEESKLYDSDAGILRRRRKRNGAAN